MTRDQDGQELAARQRRGAGSLAWPGVHQALLVEGFQVLAAVIDIAEHRNAL
jgi:hypothetical protein